MQCGSYYKSQVCQSQIYIQEMAMTTGCVCKPNRPTIVGVWPGPFFLPASHMPHFKRGGMTLHQVTHYQCQNTSCVQLASICLSITSSPIYNHSNKLLALPEKDWGNIRVYNRVFPLRTPYFLSQWILVCELSQVQKLSQEMWLYLGNRPQTPSLQFSFSSDCVGNPRQGIIMFY